MTGFSPFARFRPFAGFRRQGDGGTPPVNALVYGNTAYPVRGTASNAPASRQVAFIGDSRVAGSAPWQFASLALFSAGEWVWGDRAYNDYALGGTSIYHAVNTQAPAAVASGARVFVVLTGTNGARQSGEGDGVDTLATRQAETLALLSALDQAGATIFLCNEMPGAADFGAGTGTGETKLGHHLWIDGLTAAGAGLSNADLVIVDTWAAVSDGTESTATNLALDWRNDGLHPASQGQERMARAVWSAMNAHWGGAVHLDFASPAQNLLDGTTTASVNRGTVPGGWTDFSAANGLVYTTTGAGLDTVFTVENTTEGMLSMSSRSFEPAATTDAILFFEYDLDPVFDVAHTTGTRLFGQRFSARNFEFGTGSPVLYTSPATAGVNPAAQPYELGGRRRMALQVGACAPASTAVRADLLFDIAPGQTVRFYRVELHER